MSGESSSVDMAALAELRDIMEDEFVDLLQTFLRDSQDRLQTLRRELKEQDATAFGRTAHSLKGSCINIGAKHLGQLCLRAESSGKAGDLSAGAEMLADITAELEQVTRTLQPFLNE